MTGSVAAVIVLLVTVGFSGGGKKREAVVLATNTTPVSPAIIQSANPPIMLPAAAPSDSAPEPMGGSAATRKNLPEPVGDAAPAEKPGNKSAAKAEPVREPRPEPIALPPSLPKPAATTVAQAIDPPPLAVMGAGAMPELKATLVAPQPNWRMSTVTAPTLVKKVQPQFPPLARNSPFSSESVVLNATVRKDGNVGDISVVRGNKLFDNSAISAVKQWKYKPAIMDGEAVESTIEIVINFTNDNQD
jgi:protein TonB